MNDTKKEVKDLALRSLNSGLVEIAWLHDVLREALEKLGKEIEAMEDNFDVIEELEEN
jgi:hypothetical protein|tara:strand:+ start:557 stop:730 length:174 start_codon:yes stop_codon:yes gene_type:complete